MSSSEGTLVIRSATTRRKERGGKASLTEALRVTWMPDHLNVKGKPESCRLWSCRVFYCGLLLQRVYTQKFSLVCVKCGCVIKACYVAACVPLLSFWVWALFTSSSHCEQRDACWVRKSGSRSRCRQFVLTPFSSVWIFICVQRKKKEREKQNSVLDTKVQWWQSVELCLGK